MKRVEADSTWSLFCPDQCPGLPDCYGDEFEALYVQYEKEGRARRIIKARELWAIIIDSQTETGLPYMLYKDACNRKSNQKNLGTIRCSNLCVKSDTKILTRQGQLEIGPLEGKEVDVWNGDAWSTVTIKKTGVNRPLVRVTLSDGAIIECTPEHKFITAHQSSHKKVTFTTAERVEAKDLKPNTKLIQFSLPQTPLKGDENYNFITPYTHGFFCAEGCYGQGRRRRRPQVALYGEKQKLLAYLAVRSTSGIEDAVGRLNVLFHENLAPKFAVPMAANTSNKLEWFNGYADGAATIARNGTNESLHIASVEFEFISSVRLMLQTLSIRSSVTRIRGEQWNMMSDGRGGKKRYTCRELWRLSVSSSELQKLHALGFKPHRLEFKKRRVWQRDAAAAPCVRVISVEDRNQTADTFCFNEPLNHAGVFNGVLTSQCTEVIQYTSPEEVAVCNLASVALPKFVEKNSEGKSIFNFQKLAEVIKVMTKNLNKVIDVNYYPVKEAETSNKLHRPIGIGVQGLADAFIKMRMPFDSPEAATLNKYIFETIYFAALTASKDLAKKLGPYTTYLLNEGSPVSQGILQFDMWDVVPESKLWDWDGLRAEIKEHGVRNSLLVAPMPTASTSQILSNNEVSSKCFYFFFSLLFNCFTCAIFFCVL